MAEPVRKKIRWMTKKRKGGSRVWKWAWVEVKPRSTKKGGRSGEKPAGKA